jgi:hypothetical protein
MECNHVWKYIELYGYLSHWQICKLCDAWKNTMPHYMNPTPPHLKHDGVVDSNIYYPIKRRK